MDYKQAIEKLNGRPTRKVMHNTYLQTRDNRAIALKYHATDVITWHSDGRIVVDVDGWQTSTTKLRLNEFLPDGFRCYSDKGVWYVGRYTGAWTGNPYDREDVPYADGLTLRMNGDGHFHVDPDTVGDDPKAMLKMRQKVDKYAKAFVEALRMGKVAPPSNGDCLYCAARTVEGGTPLGETFQDKSHIESHIEESYFVPSLVVRAMEVFPCSNVMRGALSEIWNRHQAPEMAVLGKIDKGWAQHDFVWDGIRKNIKRYVLRQLGMAA